VDNSFEKLDAWLVVIGVIFVSFVLYIIAAGIYQILKRRIDNDEEEQRLIPQSGKKRTNLWP